MLGTVADGFAAPHDRVHVRVHHRIAQVDGPGRHADVGVGAAHDHPHDPEGATASLEPQRVSYLATFLTHGRHPSRPAAALLTRNRVTNRVTSTCVVVLPSHHANTMAHMW